MTVSDNLLEELDLSLKTKYEFLRLDANPVLSGARKGAYTAQHLEWVLTQYSFLPVRIVEILGCMASSAYTWPTLHEELLRNISEECGTRTQNCPHISILRDCMQKELGLDLTSATPCDATDAFLDGLVNRIRKERGSKEFVAGMAYALEDSALPELTVAAELINCVWHARGYRDRFMSKHETQDVTYANELMNQKKDADYSLEEFFAIHVLSIEVEHKAGLNTIIQKDVKTDAAANLVQSGFTFVLDSMEIWWKKLAGNGNREVSPRPAHSHVPDRSGLACEREQAQVPAGDANNRRGNR